MTVTSFILHALLVGLLVSGAAWCLDRALSPTRLPLRWIWLGALLLAIGLPVWAAVGPGMPGSEFATGVERGQDGEDPALAADLEAGPVPGLSILETRALERGLGALAARVPSGLEPVLAGGWALGSLAFLGLLLVRSHRDRRRRRSWPMARIHHRDVRIAPGTGPAVMGVLRPEIVLPAPLRREPPGTLRLVLAHEGEHVDRRDPLLLALGLLPLVAMPWNPFLWFMNRRLRAAVELDCDQRVLGTGVPAPLYGQLLVTMGLHPPRPVPGGAILALRGSRPTLERRLLAMKTRTSMSRALPTLLPAALAALLLLVVACATDSPVEDRGPADETAAAEEEADPQADVAEDPQFTPRTEEPRLLNAGDVSQRLEDRKPDDIAEGETLEVGVHIYIDEEGSVANMLVNQSSGREDVDTAALEVARTMEFSPAMNEDEPVAVWISLPIRFSGGN